MDLTEIERELKAYWETGEGRVSRRPQSALT